MWAGNIHSFLEGSSTRHSCIGNGSKSNMCFQDLLQALSVQGSVDTCLADVNMGSANVSGHHRFAA